MRLWSSQEEEGGYRREALNNLSIRRCYGSLGSPPSDVEACLAQCAEVRAWAERLDDRKWRSAYLGWVEWYEDEARQAGKEWQRRKRGQELARGAPKPPAHYARPDGGEA